MTSDGKTGEATRHVVVAVQRDDGMAIARAVQPDELGKAHLRASHRKGGKDMEQVLWRQGHGLGLDNRKNGEKQLFLRDVLFSVLRLWLARYAPK